MSELRARDIPRTYIVVPGEGHGFLRAENNVRSLGWIEDFWEDHVPVDGD